MGAKLLLTERTWDIRTWALKGAKEKCSRGGLRVGKSVEEGKCRVHLGNSPGTINGQAWHSESSKQAVRPDL